MRLKARIIILLIIAAVFPIFAVFISLNWYAKSQKESLVEMKLNSVYGGAVNLYESKGATILSQMEHLSQDQGLIRYLLVKDKKGYIDNCLSEA